MVQEKNSNCRSSSSDGDRKRNPGHKDKIGFDQEEGFFFLIINVFNH